MICSRDFVNRNKYNNETNEQLWMSILSDSHELCCSCTFPFAHLLSIIFPLGHSDRNLTINQILQRDYKEKCLSGGAGDAASGIPEEGGIKEERPTDTENKDTDDAEFLRLVAAVEDAAGTR